MAVSSALSWSAKERSWAVAGPSSNRVKDPYATKPGKDVYFRHSVLISTDAAMRKRKGGEKMRKMNIYHPAMLIID